MKFVVLSMVAAFARAADWGYEENGRNWSGACASGTKQSPIDISSEESGKEPTSAFVYAFEDDILKFNMTNNGHTIQVTPESKGHRLSYDGKDFYLAQFHFHARGEHIFDSAPRDLEVHLVHVSETDPAELAVVTFSWLAVPGAANDQFLTTIESSGFPAEGGDTVIDCSDGEDQQCADVAFLFPADYNANFVHYMGSLTTPECGEGVYWFVSRTVLTSGSEQIQSFADALAQDDSSGQPTGNWRDLPNHPDLELIPVGVEYSRYSAAATRTYSAAALLVAAAAMFVA